MTALVPDNKQHQSRQDRGRWGGGRRRVRKNEGNRKRQEKAEEIRGPAAAPEKSSLRRDLTHRKLHRVSAISIPMQNQQTVTPSQRLLFHQVHPRFPSEDLCQRCNKSSKEKVSENTDQPSAGKYYDAGQVINTSCEPGVHMTLMSHIYPGLSSHCGGVTKITPVSKPASLWKSAFISHKSN